PPAFPVASSFNTNLPSAPNNLSPLLTNTNYGQLQSMLPFLSLLNTVPPGLSAGNRSALLTAAGDTEIENFFRAIGNSSLFGNFIDSEIYFGMTTVSVNPGWRTSKGWAGEVNVTTELEFKEARRETVVRLLNDPQWPIDIRARLARDYGYIFDSSETNN